MPGRKDSSRKNKQNKQNKQKQQKQQQHILQQIFHPKFLQILGFSTAFLFAVAICVRVFRQYRNEIIPLLLTPDEFIAIHGMRVLKLFVLAITTICIIRALWFRVVQPLLSKMKSSDDDGRLQRRRHQHKPRIVTFEKIEYKLYKGDRIWESDEQAQFESLLSQLGVPGSDGEWDSFALIMNTDRTGVHLKYRYQALSKALNEQQKAKLTVVATEKNEQGGDEDSEENVLQWWLEIGLKTFDEKKSKQEMYVYNGEDYDTDEEEEEEEDDGEKEDEEENEEAGERCEIELTPKKMGLEISMEDSVMLWKIGTARVDDLNLQIQCVRCSTVRDVKLSGTWSAQSERALWCSKCKGLLRLGVRPQLLHESNHVVCHVDRSDSVDVLDILPSSFAASCGVCITEKETMFENFLRGRRFEKNCTNCGTKMALFTKQFSLKDLDVLSGRRSKASGRTGGTGGSGGGKEKSKKNSSGTMQVRLVVGESLPSQGSCKHFRKSLRWMRFPCCGKLYACPVCHELAGECENASTTWATRMVCGKCSVEQSFSNGACTSCSFHMGKNKGGGAHWQGGLGSRDQTTMSKKDRKKKGPAGSSSKKTTSKKSSRVGAVAKKNREKKKLAKQ